MKKYNIPITNVIRHFDVTGKLCPRPLVDNVKWNGYIQDVQDCYKALGQPQTNEKKEDDNLYQNIKQVPEWARGIISELIEKGCFADVEKLNLSDEMVRIFVIMDRRIG